MAKLIYSNKDINIENSSSKEHINIKFNSKADFVNFFNDFDVESLRNYKLINDSGESIDGYGQAISGIVIKFVGTGQLQVRIDIVQFSESQILKDTVETLATSAIKNTDQWASKNEYKFGDLVVYGGSLYKTIQSHTSQDDWTPDVAHSLFTKVYTIQTEEEHEQESSVAEWIQPTGAHDSYSLNEIVMHNGKMWKSSINDNVWEPSVYGWEEVIQ